MRSSNLPRASCQPGAPIERATSVGRASAVEERRLPPATERCACCDSRKPTLLHPREMSRDSFRVSARRVSAGFELSSPVTGEDSSNVRRGGGRAPEYIAVAPLDLPSSPSRATAFVKRITHSIDFSDRFRLFSQSPVQSKMYLPAISIAAL